MAHKLGEDACYYINFEDDRFLGFQAEDANDLYQALVEVFGERQILMVDEIQNIPGWEHFVRRLMDLGKKFFITGSNASLLSRELGTRLTGRYFPIELFPFSFEEFLIFRDESVPDFSRITTLDRARLNSALLGYLQSGGIPDSQKYPELPLLRTLYDDILYRDIAARYRLDAVTALRGLAYSLISNPGGLISYNKLKEQLRLASVNTVSSYVDYMENSWLVFALNRYEYSVKRQLVLPKKIYWVDTGMVNAVGFQFSPNSGKLLENIVFLALRRRTKEIYYYTTANGYEVDFYLPEQRLLIQVAQHIENPDTRERETRALSDAIGRIQVDRALILTDSNQPGFDLNGVEVTIKALPDWLLED
ncbi:MAG TPA: ATP-binding protein [Levilinea sp.]|nr:ATP-binding protein [Levilinea sp.]